MMNKWEKYMPNWRWNIHFWDSNAITLIILVNFVEWVCAISGEAPEISEWGAHTFFLAIAQSDNDGNLFNIYTVGTRGWERQDKREKSISIFEALEN